MNIGLRIKELRKEKGLTQKELAKRAKIAAITVQQYERGVRQPKLEQLREIATALNVSVDLLLGINLLPDLMIDIDKDAGIYQRETSQSQEDAAVFQYVESMGYEYYRDDFLFEYNNSNGTDWDYILLDKRNDRRYLVNYEDIEKIYNTVNSFLKFQFTELVTKLPEFFTNQE